MTLPLLVTALALGSMPLEYALSRRHERALLEAGASEGGNRVTRAMGPVYPLIFVACAAESVLRGGTAVRGAVAGGALVFVAAKLLKAWAIATLGPLWTYKLIIPQRPRLVLWGPYRFVRHPNYLAVIGELVGVALALESWVAGTTGLAVFGWLLRARIREEERLLAARTGYAREFGSRPRLLPGL